MVWRTRGALCAAVVAVVAAAGCGQLKLGSFPPDADGNAGPAPPKPIVVQAWEPQPAEQFAKITAVAWGLGYAAVGFSDGELYRSSVGSVPPWTRLDASSQAGVRSTPHFPVSALLIDDSVTPPAICVGYVGPSGQAKLWVSLDAASDWIDHIIPGTPDDVHAFSRSPFDRKHLLVSHPTGIASSLDGGRTWGPGTWTPPGHAGSFTAITEGQGPAGSRRAWLGNETGTLFAADSPAGAAWPATLTWSQISTPALLRTISSIAVNAADPAEVWLSLKHLDGANGLWRSTNHGQSFFNVHNPRLLTYSYGYENSAIGMVAINPTLGIHYVTTIFSASDGTGSAVGMWSTDGGQTWYLN
jgi:hypothetical protein